MSSAVISVGECFIATSTWVYYQLVLAIAVVSAISKLFYYTLGALHVFFLLPRISLMRLHCASICVSLRVLSGCSAEVVSAFQVIHQLGAVMRLLVRCASGYGGHGQR